MKNTSAHLVDIQKSNRQRLRDEATAWQQLQKGLSSKPAKFDFPKRRKS